jgi:hypothetical protein
VGLDAHGNPVHRPFTVFRLEFRRPPMRWGGLVQDMEFDRIIVPRPEPRG